MASILRQVIFVRPRPVTPEMFRELAEADAA